MHVSELRGGNLVVRQSTRWLVIAIGISKFNGVAGPYVFKVFQCDPRHRYQVDVMFGGRMQGYLDEQGTKVIR